MQIIEFLGLSNRPMPGSKLALYLDTVTGVFWRWTGSAWYVPGWNADQTAFANPNGGADIPLGGGGGAPLTLGANLDALIALTGKSTTSLYMAQDTDIIYSFDGSNLDPQTFDRDLSGNIYANVNQRTGTVASLLGIAGGVGEISVASDVAAIVVHNGVLGGAKAFYQNGFIGTTILRASAALSIPSDGSTATTADFTYAKLNTAGAAVDLTLNTITVPANARHMRITARGSFADPGAAPVGFRRIQVLVGTVLYSFTAAPAASTTLSTAFTTDLLSVDALNSSGVSAPDFTPGTTTIGLGVLQNQGVALNFTVATLAVDFYA